MEKILTVGNKKDEKFLRRKTDDFDFQKFSRKEISELISKMKQLMREANGVGLSANQIGLNLKFFVAEIPDPQGGTKFYAVFNPKMEKMSGEKVVFDEGCLSVPGKYGVLERSEKVVLGGFDKNGKPIKIKAWGLLARVFQHETDHLNGKLFLDRTKRVFEVKPTGSNTQP